MLSHVAYTPKVAKAKTPSFSKETEAALARSQRNVQDSTRPMVMGDTHPPMHGGSVPMPTTRMKEAQDAVLEKATQIVTKLYQSNMIALEKAASL